jgi:4-hydroxyphenylpyruvate dioxygenase
MALHPAIPTMSLGQPGTHSLPTKLAQASSHGFTGIELFIADLDHLAATSFSGDTLAAARHTRTLCASLNLTILCLQPFTSYEGLLDRSPETHHALTAKLTHWLVLAHALATDIIQIPSNFLGADPATGAPRTSPDPALIVADLRRAADLAAAQDPPVRVVYEALAWGDHVKRWEQSYELVCAADRPNLGVCLDTFHILGLVYADPCAAEGVRRDGEVELRESLSRLRETVDPRKVFYVQVVDGERLAAPLVEGHEFFVEGRDARMCWSRNARLFACEEDRGGYLPVLDVVKAFLDTGFAGWVSLELFSRSLADPAPAVPGEHARRGMVSWEKMHRRLGLYSEAAVMHRL